MRLIFGRATSRGTYAGIFFVIIAAYFLIGLHGIKVNSLTADEPAYIGAGYAYTKGVGVNPEHPLLLKLLNAVVIRASFPNIQPPVPELKSFDSRGGIRIAAYAVGYDFLMARPDKFFSIIFASRLVYLIFNSLLLFWLVTYSLYFKLINPQWAVILATLYVFSPPFYGHASLVAFDVPTAICALMSILSLAILAYRGAELSPKLLVTQFVITTILACFALNTKYSNLLLLPIFGLAYAITTLCLFWNGNKKRAYLFASLSLLSILLQPLFIWAMLRIAFSSVPIDSPAGTFAHYWNGIRLTASTVRGATEPFLFGRFVSIDYLQYVQRIWWFKENPLLFVLLIGSAACASVEIIKRRNHLRELIQQFDRKRLYPVIGCILLITSYPVIYSCLAKYSRFVIGYRYFYPVIIFIYFYLAVLTTRAKSRLLALCLVLYAIVGLAGVPQSLSYVNPLWRQEKWRLTDESTLNWGQETQHAVQYLLDQRALPYHNSDTMAYRTASVVINVPEYVSVLSFQQKYPVDSKSYLDAARVDPLDSDYAQLAHNYLIIDSSVIQRTLRNASVDRLAAKNWEFLTTRKPIYSRNGIIFVYQLHEPGGDVAGSVPLQ